VKKRSSEEIWETRSEAAIKPTELLALTARTKAVVA
jgi:hypothetical protein